MSGYRLPGFGGVRRDQPVSFTFDERPYSGFTGDTLASALLASGVKLVARSFKYHRPRGILTAGSEEPNALVELRGGARREPNTRATVAELFDGLEARSQNCWPSLGFDLGAVNSLLSRVLVAGFYYKTFMWPAGFWERLYEPLIRRAAGMGQASLEPDPDLYEKAHAFCDVLVIGAGPAGLAAALGAARAGARVIIADEDFCPGGRLNGDVCQIDGDSGVAWVAGVLAELQSLPDVRIMSRTSVFGAFDGNTYGALERVSDHLRVPPAGQPRQRLWKIVARRVVLAAGATERPIVFADNDRPGVMLASAVRTYVNRFRVTPGRNVALFTSCDDGWKTAADLARAGVQVAAIVDSRPAVAPGLAELAKRHDVRLMLGSRVERAHGGSLTIRDSRGQASRVRADALAVAGGWNPNTALSTHLGGKPRWSSDINAYLPGEMPRGMTAVGAAAGDYSLSGALRAGAAAGSKAAASLGFGGGVGVAREPSWHADDELVDSAPLWSVPALSGGKAFVDFQHDVTADDVALAAREGYRSADLLKRYTTLGMATDQGKTSTLAGHAIMAALTGCDVADLGTITSRPPYTPVALGALAGAHRGKDFKPFRLTAGHSWAQERGATFVETGYWLRAQWFAAPGESDWRTTVAREVNGVRNGVGVCDVSTLGKIDVQGADAAAFLDRVYSNLISTLPIGKVRYGLMLREDGIVMDDGTVAHIARGHYLLSTTTANAAKVMQHLEYARQVLWPELDVQLASITEQWAQFAVAGPRSRELLERLLQGSLALADAAFPHLACAEFLWRGRPARLFRMSFCGEMAYELAVPAGRGDMAVRSLMAHGEPLGVVPYGTEALGVMRIEKGHAAGNELNGTTTATDLGLGKLMSKKKDFIGRVLAGRPGLSSSERMVLVGVKPVKRLQRLYAGSHFLSLGAAATLENDQGFISSVAYSATLGCWIGLGFLARGATRHGERIRAHDPLRSGDVEVEVTDPVFYDRQGSRLNFSLAPVDSGPGAPLAADVTVRGIARVIARKGARDGLAQKVRERFPGLELPTSPRRVSNGESAVLGVRPDTWLFFHSGGFESLEPHASVCDQSDAYTIMRVESRETLSRLVPVDLHPRNFPPGAVAETIIHHMGVLLWRLEDSAFEVAVPRSVAAGVRHLL